MPRDALPKFREVRSLHIQYLGKLLREKALAMQQVEAEKEKIQS